MELTTISKEAGSVAALADLRDAKAVCPASPCTQILERSPEGIATAWIIACRFPPDLPCDACDAYGRGGLL